jgi:hypothetical protein
MAAPNSYNTTTLVSNVQLIAHIPLSNATFLSPQIITLADRELQTSLVAQITSVREGYYLSYEDFDTATNGEYLIPSQAIGGSLEAIEIVDNSSIIPVNRVEQSEQFSTNVPTATTYGYYIRGNTIKVLPSDFSGGLRVWFLRRPNALVATSACGSITAIASNVITVSSLPTTFVVGTTVDLCQDQPTFNVLSSPTITAISGTDVTLSAVPDDLAVFDWLCLQNQTPVPQVPVEFRPILEQRVAVKIYELQGYLDKMKAAESVLAKMEKDMFTLISPRVKSQTKLINPQNGGFNNTSGRYSSKYWSGR